MVDTASMQGSARSNARWARSGVGFSVFEADKYAIEAAFSFVEAGCRRTT